jgi:hypothetical protein
MKNRKHDPDYYIHLLTSRKERLSRLITFDAPDVIIWHEMKLVAEAQREVYGRHWNHLPFWRRISLWWRLR